MTPFLRPVSAKRRIMRLRPLSLGCAPGFHPDSIIEPFETWWTTPQSDVFGQPTSGCLSCCIIDGGLDERRKYAARLSSALELPAVQVACTRAGQQRVLSLFYFHVTLTHNFC